MYYLEEFYKERYCGRKPAIFWLVFFSYMCIINMYESVRQVHKMDYTVLDLEMTGLAPKRDKVIEIGAVRVRNGEIADTYGTLVRPGFSITETVVMLTGITDEMAALGKEEESADKVEAAAGIVCVVPCADGICEFPAGVYTVCTGAGMLSHTDYH